LAESLVKVYNDHIITSILNTREQDVELPKPVVEVVELRDRDAGETAVIGVAEQEKGRDDPGQSRGERVIATLRTDHLMVCWNEFCEDRTVNEMTVNFPAVNCVSAGRWR
jgi:ferric iron reductase protein FhuF